MKNENELAGVSFKLQDGNIINISKEDIKIIADKLIIEMVANDQTKVYIMDDSALKRAQLLYDLYKNHCDSIPEETKADYLTNILYLVTENNIELITLESAIAKMPKKE